MIELSQKTDGSDPCSLIFRKAAVVTLNRNETKGQVFSQLLRRLTDIGAIRVEATAPLFDQLLAKERSGTCALGNGLALPHLRTRWVDDFASAIGTAPHGLDFDALDGRPTRLVILLLSPFDERQRHLEIMGRLAALLHDHTLPYWLQGSWQPRELLDYLDL